MEVDVDVDVVGDAAVHVKVHKAYIHNVGLQLQLLVATCGRGSRSG